MPADDKRAGSVAVVGVVLSLACLSFAIFLSRLSGAACSWLSVPVALTAFLVWSFLWIHVRMRQAALQEQMDLQSLQERRQDISLFQDESTLKPDLLSAGSRLNQFDKYAVPCFSVLISIVLMGSCYWGWVVLLLGTSDVSSSHSLTGVGFFSGMALACFLVGRYASGLASIPACRLIRPGASFTLGFAASSGMVVVGLASHHFGAPVLERFLAHIMACFLGLLGLEIALNQVLDFYRPKVEGQEWRPSFDSRSLAILGSRTSLFKTVADTLNYQFGFEVSETWFYRFFQKAIAPLLLFQLLALYLLTCLVVIGPEEQAVLETFGRKSLSETQVRILGPGLHLKWPWPVQNVYREKTRRVREILLGRPEGQTLKTSPDRLPAILWTSTHFDWEYPFLMASERAGHEIRMSDDSSLTVPVNIVSGQITVHYRIKNLVNYLYGHMDPDRLVENIAYRELVHYLAGEDALKLLGQGRTFAGKWLQQVVQSACDQQQLGVEVVFVGLQDVHPPIVLPPGAVQTGTAMPSVGSVGEAFEGVVAAEAQRHALILEAEAYQAKTLALAKGEAYIETERAEAYGYRRIAVAKAEADAFLDRLQAFDVSPEVYRSRKHLDAVEEALSSARKFILPTDGGDHEVTMLDWEEKLRTDLLDLNFREEVTR